MNRYDFVVLGGGVSGLGFAKRISDAGKSVLILEKEEIVGGLSRTLHHKGFYLDFCAHRFHTNNKMLLQEVLELEGLTMRAHSKVSRIYMFDRYLKYPFEIESLLRAMPIRQSVPAVVSYLGSLVIRRWGRKKELRSYRDWFVSLYGKRLYEIMCLPYTSKIWHTDPSLLSADWADQRFRKEDLKKLVRRSIKKLLTLNFSSYNLEEDSLAPDGGIFYYPEKGIQELPNALARKVIMNAGYVQCGAVVTSIDNKHKMVTYSAHGKLVKVLYDTLISTIPLHTFYTLQSKKSLEIEKTLESLLYMNIVFVYLFLKKDHVSKDHWLYFPDPDIIFNRAVEFKNWSKEMCPPGMTSICFDITTFAGDAVDHASDEDLKEKVIHDATRIHYINKEDVDSYLVVRIPYAYPFYDLEYKSKLTRIASFLEGEDVFLLGRTGLFRYNNSDNSIEMGFELADKILQGIKNKSIVEYTIKNVSL